MGGRRESLLRGCRPEALQPQGKSAGKAPQPKFLLLMLWSRQEPEPQLCFAAVLVLTCLAADEVLPPWRPVCFQPFATFCVLLRLSPEVFLRVVR